MKNKIRQFVGVLLLVAASTFTANSFASGGGAVAVQMMNVPPETKIKMLRVIFEDVFGTPEELRAQFVAACNARQNTTSTAVSQPAAASAAASKSYSREATLAALCMPAARRGIESALSPKKPAPISGASAPKDAQKKAPSAGA